MTSPDPIADQQHKLLFESAALDLRAAARSLRMAAGEIRQQVPGSVVIRDLEKIAADCAALEQCAWRRAGVLT